LIANNETCCTVKFVTHNEKLWQAAVKKKNTFNFDVSKKPQHNCLEYFLLF